MSQPSELTLKSIHSLLSMSFYIPAYQRGYRWDKRQVTELLNDIKEFQQQSEEGAIGAFYCLQPIVVKRQGDCWELVDGQQRLTTIYIILTYLKDLMAMMGLSRYQLRFETRETSANFLENIDEQRAEENIDFFHIVEAKQAVDAWFKQQDGPYQIKFFQTLLNGDSTGKNVKVIWYEIPEAENAVDIFTRLNMGKIPLVNAELVKALFLKSSNFAGCGRQASGLLQHNIAQEWDAIEKRLQDDAFWYFISNTDTRSNRIDFVLNLRARQLASTDILSSDKLKIFLQYNQLLNQKDTDVSHEWLRIKQNFMTIEEWFNDRNLYHLIGYLIARNIPLETLFDSHQQCTSKAEFVKTLHKQIFAIAFSSFMPDTLDAAQFRERLMALDYEYGAETLHPILLLFNIASLLANPKTNARFQFDRYKQEKWDIEHIRAISEDVPPKPQQQDWLKSLVDYLSAPLSVLPREQQYSISDEELAIKKQAEALLQQDNPDNDDFASLYHRVRKFYDTDNNSYNDDAIGNLTLLDSSTNRSYKNAIFPVKRARIIALDKKATFVPLCTKNVFLKYYSKRENKLLYWTENDCWDHMHAMADALAQLFSDALPDYKQKKSGETPGEAS